MWNDLIRLDRLPAVGSAQRKVLFVTNMWPDEKRPYYGSFIASQARSLPRAATSVDVLYVRGFLGARSYAHALLAVPHTARREPYDLIHIHYGHTALASLCLRQRPLVISFCGGDLLGVPHKSGITTKSRVEVAVFRQVARTATMTITKSEEMQRALPRSVQARNVVLPNGVDLDVFSPRPRDQARAELGWPLDDKVILFVGNPDESRKNVALARDVAELVARQIHTARLHVAWGVRPDEVPCLMNASDCLLFTSRSEGSPNVIKEAMACALPVVATPVGDIPERLRDVGNCYVREASCQALADAVMLAFDHGRAPDARAAVEGLGISAVANRLTAVYDKATELHQRSGYAERDVVDDVG